MEVINGTIELENDCKLTVGIDYNHFAIYGLLTVFCASINEHSVLWKTKVNLPGKATSVGTLLEHAKVQVPKMIKEARIRAQKYSCNYHEQESLTKFAKQVLKDSGCTVLF